VTRALFLSCLMLVILGLVFYIGVGVAGR